MRGRVRSISEKRVGHLEKDHGKVVFWPRCVFDSFCANKCLEQRSSGKYFG